MNLNRTMKLILAILKVTGPQSTLNIIRIVYAGQTGFFKKQEQYVGRCLGKLEGMGLIKEVTMGLDLPLLMKKAWKITQKGREIY